MPRPSSNQPGRRAGTRPIAIPIRSCTRWGLPCRPCCQSRGALLPHPFDLTRPKAGGVLSVALSLSSIAEASEAPPGVTRHRCSVEPGLSSPDKSQRGRPALWHIAHMIYCGRGSNRASKLRPAFAVDDPVDQVGPEAALECDHGLLLVGHVIAEPLEREEESGIGPIGIDQFARRARQREPALCKRVPRETARPDPPCAPERRRNGQRHRRGRSRDAP